MFQILLQVKRAIQQIGYRREKRGYKPLKGVPLSEIKLSKEELATLIDGDDQYDRTNRDPIDPLFAKEWYLVSFLILLYIQRCAMVKNVSAHEYCYFTIIKNNIFFI